MRRREPSGRLDAARRVAAAPKAAAVEAVEGAASIVGVIETGRTWRDLPAEAPAQPARADVDAVAS
jgi:hypothetical protein